MSRHFYTILEAGPPNQTRPRVRSTHNHSEKTLLRAVTSTHGS